MFEDLSCGTMKLEMRGFSLVVNGFSVITVCILLGFFVFVSMTMPWQTTPFGGFSFE